MKTIPLYPNYAINDKLEVQNLTSGKILNPSTVYKGHPSYRLMKKGKLDSIKALDLFICAHQRFDLVI